MHLIQTKRFFRRLQHPSKPNFKNSIKSFFFQTSNTKNSDQFCYLEKTAPSQLWMSPTLSFQPHISPKEIPTAPEVFSYPQNLSSPQKKQSSPWIHSNDTPFFTKSEMSQPSICKQTLQIIPITIFQFPSIQNHFCASPPRKHKTTTQSTSTPSMSNTILTFRHSISPKEIQNAHEVF